jgi:hypothetical protein
MQNLSMKKNPILLLLPMSRKGFFISHLLVTCNTKEFIFFVGVQAIFELLKSFLQLAKSNPFFLNKWQMNK